MLSHVINLTVICSSMLMLNTSAHKVSLSSASPPLFLLGTSTGEGGLSPPQFLLSVAFPRELRDSDLKFQFESRFDATMKIPTSQLEHLGRGHLKRPGC